MVYKQIIIALALTCLAGCSPTTTDIFWVNQYGEPVPIVVTQKQDTTVYDFGTIIMLPDTSAVDTLR